MLNIVNAINIQVDNYSKNFNVERMKQNYCNYCIQDLNQTKEEKNASGETITVPSLGGSNQWSSITKKTNDDLYDIKLGWDSTSLKTGRDTIFIISFINHKTNLEEKEIEYSFKVIYPTANVTIKDVKHQKAPTGTGVQIVKFPIPGPVNISVRLTTAAPEQPNINEIKNKTNNNITSFSESVIFYIMIPPTGILNKGSLTSST